jgi:hypothetical protein
MTYEEKLDRVLRFYEKHGDMQQYKNSVHFDVDEHKSFQELKRKESDDIGINQSDWIDIINHLSRDGMVINYAAVDRVEITAKGKHYSYARSSLKEWLRVWTPTIVSIIATLAAIYFGIQQNSLERQVEGLEKRVDSTEDMVSDLQFSVETDRNNFRQVQLELDSMKHYPRMK